MTRSFRSNQNMLYDLHPSIEPIMRKPLKALITGSCLAILYCSIFAVVFSWVGSWMVAMCFLYGLITFGFILMLRRYGRGDYFIGGFSVLLISFLLTGVYEFGWECGFQYPLVAALSYAFLPRFENIIYPVLVCLANLGAFFLGYYHIQYLNPSTVELTVTMTNVMYVANVSIAFSAVAILSYLFEKDAYESEKQVFVEKEKSEDLLHNILPSPIATRLKENPKIIADGFESVSVMFADIVGFTRLSTVFSPDELVAYLNGIFSHFDSLAQKYELEKIKTIGDAYMVSGGLPAHTPGHLERMADMALDMLKFVEAHDHIGEQKLEIRIGLHTGPVVAGVIGIKKFAYDLWGDTVNIASRMESNGEPSKINVTGMVKGKLNESYEFEVREPMEIKGKGMMQTYFLTGKKGEE